MNIDYLALLEDITYVTNKSADPELLNCSDEEFIKYLSGMNLDPFTKTFLHSKQKLNRFYLEHSHNLDPFNEFVSNDSYLNILSYYPADSFEVLFDFLDSVFILNLVRLPLEDEAVQYSISTHLSELELCKNKSFKKLFKKHQELQHQLISNTDLIEDQMAELKKILVVWFDTFNVFIVDYYEILIEKRINEINNHCMDLTDDKEICIYRSALNRAIEDLNSIAHIIPARILNLIFPDLIPDFSPEECDHEILFKARAVRNEIFKETHPDSLSYLQATTSAKKIKRSIYEKAISLDQGRTYLESIEDLWVSYITEISQVKNMKLPIKDRLNLLRQGNRNLGKQVSILRAQAEAIASHISAISMELLHKDDILETIRKEQLPDMKEEDEYGIDSFHDVMQ